MDILNELRSQAEKRQESLTEEQAHKEMVEHRYKTEIRPAMLAIKEYLDELVAHIAFVNTTIPFYFEIPGYGLVKDLVLREHGVTVDSMNNLSRVSYAFACSAREPLVFRVTPKEEAAECQAFLMELKQKFTEWPLRGRTGETAGSGFEVEFVVPIVLRFLADIERGHIVMAYTNFEQIGTRKLAFRAAQIDRDWLNRLGAFVLKRSDELVRLPVEEERLAAIRKKLAAEEQARNRELGLPEPKEQQPAGSAKGGSLLGKIKARISESDKKG